MLKRIRKERLTCKNLERKSKKKRDSKRFYSFVDLALLLLFQRWLLRVDVLVFWRSLACFLSIVVLSLSYSLAGFAIVLWRANVEFKRRQLRNKFTFSCRLKNLVRSHGLRSHVLTVTLRILHSCNKILQEYAILQIRHLICNEKFKKVSKYGYLDCIL